MQPDYRFRYDSAAGRAQAGLVPGLVLIGIGALFFLRNLHIIYIRDWVSYWPVILIALGLVKLVDSSEMGGRVCGGILMGLGAIFLAQSMGLLYPFRVVDLWPLIPIGLGLLMLFQRSGHLLPESWGSRTSAAGVLDEHAVFGGGKRNISSQDFKGGQLSAVFGGFEVDLRKAEIVGDSAELEVNAVFGGAEIKIPLNWSAVLQGVGIFGAFTDETTQPDELRVSGIKRLVVKGSAVFGGVVVKN